MNQLIHSQKTILKVLMKLSNEILPAPGGIIRKFTHKIYDGGILSP